MDEYAQDWEPHLASKLFEFDKRRQKAAEDMRNRRETENERYYSEYGQLTQTRFDEGMHFSLKKCLNYFPQENWTRPDHFLNFSAKPCSFVIWKSANGAV